MYRSRELQLGRQYVQCLSLTLSSHYSVFFVLPVVHISNLWSNTLWVTREEGRLANVGQAQKEHDDTFQPNTSTSMWLRSVAEGIDVGFNVLQVNAPRLGTLFNHVGFVNTLGATQNLLAADKEIVRIGQLGVLWVGHGVERTDREGVLVHEEKISAVLFGHQVTELLFIQGTQVVIIVLALCWGEKIMLEPTK